MKDIRSVMYKNRTGLYLAGVIVSYIALIISVLMFTTGQKYQMIISVCVVGWVGAIGFSGVKGMVRDVRTSMAYKNRE